MDDTRPEAEKQAAATQEVAELRTVAADNRAVITAEAAGHRQTVRQQGVAQQVAVRATQAAKLAAVAQGATATKAALTGGANAERAALRAQVDADVGAAAAATAERVAAARTAVQARRETLRNAAETDRSSALAAADAEATRAVGEIESAAIACEQAGEQEAARFAGEDDPRPEQRSASRQVGRESAADIRAKKPSVPGELRGQAVEHGRRCVDYVLDLTAKLSETEQTLVAEIQQAGSEAQTAIREGLTGALSAVDTRLRQDIAAVDATSGVARTQLDGAAEQVATELETGISGAERELDTAAAAVGADLERGADETATVIGEVEQPFLPGVREQVAAARAGMAGSVDGARSQLASAVSGAQVQFASVAQGFTASADSLLAQLGDQQARIREGFSNAVGQVRSARAQTVGEILAGLAQRQQGLTDAVLAQADAAVAEAKGKLAEMSGQFRDGIRQAADRSVEEASRPRTDDVNTRAREAGEQVDEGWLAGLGRALVQIAIGLVILVVVALIVAAIAAAFGFVLTAWTAVMIAGAILLAIGLVVNLVLRFRQQQLQGRPGLAILLAVSDTVGITGIIEGIRGKELITNQPLSDAARTERGVLGAVTLIGIILGARAAIKGPPGGAYTRPVQLPAGLRARMATGMKSVAAELASGAGRTIRAVKEWIFGKSEKPAGCFVPGTPVLTPSGTVSIEALAIGDVVIAQDPENGVLGPEQVLMVSTRTVPTILDISVAGNTVTCSPEHPFWVVGAGWTRAGNLRVGDRVRTSEAELEVSAVQPRHRRGWPVHNITVAGPHTYHVGPMALLVHNKAVEADFVPRQRIMQSEAQGLSQRAGQAVNRARALPEETPNRTGILEEAEGLSREARELQSEINRSSSLEQLADAEDYQASIRDRLAALEERLPAGTTPPPEGPPTRVSFSEEAAMARLQTEGHWQRLNTDHPGRTWSGRFAEQMPSNNPLQTKQKMLVTGRIAGQPPVTYEFSVVYDHPSGQFTYVGRSGGRGPTH